MTTSLSILPILHPLRAGVRVPGSKSLTNRALAIAALADGTTVLTNALDSDDSRYFADSLQHLGFDIQSAISNLQSAITVHGLGGRIPNSRADLIVGNAGTSARFNTSIATLGHGEYTLDGVERMRQRPIGDLVAALNALGAHVEPLAHPSSFIPQPSICPPVRVIASGLRGGTARVAGDTSSQFLSALLIAAPYAQSPVELIVERGLNSKPYVDMTLAVMADFGVTVEREGYERFRVRPQRYRAVSEYAIENDASAASYFFAAPAVCGGTVRVQNISRRSQQGDIAFLDVLERMGCVITEGENWIEVVGAIHESPLHELPLRGVDVDLRDLPDMAQTLAAIAPFADSPTTIRGIASARVKETDRVAAMCNELRRLGVTVDEHPDGLTIYPCANLQPAVIHTYDDHRMAMAFALVGLRAPGIAIENPGCVSKTFPNYFDVLEELRG
ncbi:MAG: 3-phosphoshikimate 1-carboxyvinyltransferase [Chloroflexi bacterium]|nr:3-phosphoshikimate 1-carboxyvinyltransferase [Chloroflexota bacterium]